MIETRALASATAQGAPALDFRDIRLTYTGKGAPLTVIEHISFRVAQGEFVSLVGPSGCGKTTLLRMVSGLNPAEEGAVYFHGQPITGPLKNIGIAFQNPVLLILFLIRAINYHPVKILFHLFHQLLQAKATRHLLSKFFGARAENGAP